MIKVKNLQYTKFINRITFISAISHIVLNSLTNHGHGNHKHQRQNRGCRIQRGYNRYGLQYRHYQEVYICESFELHEQAHWQERQRRILCGSDVIWFETFGQVSRVVVQIKSAHGLAVVLEWRCSLIGAQLRHVKVSFICYACLRRLQILMGHA